jgi:DNA-binding beta-propeller fold protein YncE
MTPNFLRPARHGLAAGLLAVTTLSGAGASVAAAGHASRMQVTIVASGLDQPKKITIEPDGTLLVALSGDGVAPKSCTDADELSCRDGSGAIDAISPDGKVRRLLSGLTSISSGHDDPQATGPIEALRVGRTIEVLYQDLDLDSTTGVTLFGRSSLLGDLVAYGGSARDVQAQLGPYEATDDPAGSGAGTAVKYGYESAINSDPYSFVRYDGGYAIADAGANDVLFLSGTGHLRVLAVLPTITEHAAARSFGSSQKKATEARAQAVPTSIAVGPDGALYVGELGGSPFDRGTSSVYRIVPGHRATVFARGFTAIGDLAFDQQGRLLVLELDREGLNDPGLNDGHPASGEIIRVDPGGRKTTLVSTGLYFPTGVAVSRGGTVYLTEFGLDSANADGHGGEVVKLGP